MSLEGSYKFQVDAAAVHHLGDLERIIVSDAPTGHLAHGVAQAFGQLVCLWAATVHHHDARLVAGEIGDLGSKGVKPPRVQHHLPAELNDYALAGHALQAVVRTFGPGSAHA